MKSILVYADGKVETIEQELGCAVVRGQAVKSLEKKRIRRIHEEQHKLFRRMQASHDIETRNNCWKDPVWLTAPLTPFETSLIEDMDRAAFRRRRQS